MAVKKKAGASAKRTANAKAVRVHGSIMKPIDSALFRERTERMKLMHAAYRPQIEHIQAISDGNRAAVRRYESFAQKATKWRKSPVLGRPRPGGGDPMWVDPDKLKYFKPPRVMLLDPREFVTEFPTPMTTGTGSWTYYPGIRPFLNSFGGDFDPGALGSVQARQSIGVPFDAFDTGYTYLPLLSNAQGSISARSTFGLANIVLAVQTRVLDMAGNVLEQSAPQVYGSETGVLGFDIHVYTASWIDVGLGFDRVAGKRYWIWYDYHFFAASVLSQVTVRQQGAVGSFYIQLFD